MTPTIVNSSFYCQFEDENPVGIKESYVGDPFFEQERMNSKLTLVLHLNDLKQMEARKHSSNLLEWI